MCLSSLIWPLQDETFVKFVYTFSFAFQAVKMEELI